MPGDEYAGDDYDYDYDYDYDEEGEEEDDTPQTTKDCPELVLASGDGSPPLFQGTLWKKSPNPLRMRRFQKRYVELSLGCLTWSAEKGKPIKGRLDFSKNECEVSETVGSTTEFEVRPRGGAWIDGDFSGVDSGRFFIFDTQDNEYDRSRWIEAVSLHISYGMTKQVNATTEALIDQELDELSHSVQQSQEEQLPLQDFVVGDTVLSCFDDEWFVGTINDGPNDEGEYEVRYNIDDSVSWVRPEDLVATKDFVVGDPVSVCFDDEWFDGTINDGPNDEGEYEVLYNIDDTVSWVRPEELVAKEIVAILVILYHEGREYTLVVRQPRVAVCSSSFVEIPAGMLDEEGNFAGVVAKEMKEEAGIQIIEDDLIDMTHETYQDKYPGVFPKCGGFNEFKRFFLYRKVVTAEELANLNVKLTGVLEEGEMIKLQIIPLEALWRSSADAKALVALCLYRKLHDQEKASTHVICIGNPGAGKSTLLNSLMRELQFCSGISMGSGLTKRCEKHKCNGVVYVDTPGLADAMGRERAADSINQALTTPAPCKILFVITLEGGHIRYEDQATMQLVLEALPRGVTPYKNIAVVVNKASQEEADRLEKDKTCFDFLQKRINGQNIQCVLLNEDADDKDNTILNLAKDFVNFVADLPSAPLGEVNVQHDKYERILRQLEEDADTRKHKYEELLAVKRYRSILKVLEENKDEDMKKRMELRARQDGIQALVSHWESNAPERECFAVGERIVLLDRFVFPSKEITLEPGQGGTVISIDGDSFTVEVESQQKEASAIGRLSFEKSEFIEGRFCKDSGKEVHRRRVVSELVSRGIEVGEILKFYGSLLSSDTFQPSESTTKDVALAHIIPKTKDAGLAYATLVHPKGKMAERMVSHHWNNRFSHMVAAVVADALDEPFYVKLLDQMSTASDLEKLGKKLEDCGKSNVSYWVCPFSVNQHRSICKDNNCDCKTVRHGNSSPLCEMDQFEEMMLSIFDIRNDLQGQGHVIVIDQEGEIFDRAWVMAELVAVMSSKDLEKRLSEKQLRQSFVAYDETSVGKLMEKQGVNIFSCKASRKEDTEMIKLKAHAKMREMGVTSKVFHEMLNTRIQGCLGKTMQLIEDRKKVNVLLIGNPGVGTRTICNSLIGSKALNMDSKPGELNRFERGDGFLFMEIGGLVDSSSREKAAKEITLALRRDGIYQLMFVVTLESGRARPQDTEMMTLVLEAVNRSVGDQYSVIVNKVTEATMAQIPHSKVELEQSLFGFRNPLCHPPALIEYVAKSVPDDMTKLPEKFLDLAPSVHINSASVARIDGETIEAKSQNLREEIEKIDIDIARLKDQLESADHKVAVVGDVNSGKTTFATRLLENVAMLMGSRNKLQIAGTKCRTKVTASDIPGLSETTCDFTYKHKNVNLMNLSTDQLFRKQIDTFEHEPISSNLCEIRINMAEAIAGITIVDHPGFVAHDAAVTGKCFEDTMKELYKGSKRDKVPSVVLVHDANARPELANFVIFANTFREIPEGKLYVAVTKADMLCVGDIWQQQVRPHLEAKNARRTPEGKYECTAWDIMKIIMARIRNPFPTKPGTALPDHAKMYFLCGFSKSFERLKSGSEIEIWELFDKNCRENEDNMRDIFLDTIRWQAESGDELVLKEMSKEEKTQFNNHIGFDFLQKEIYGNLSASLPAVQK